MQFPTLSSGGVGDSPRRTKNAEAPELDLKTRKVTDKFTDALEAIANEPTLALYRVQEHTRKSLPTLVEKRISTGKQRQRVEGMTYDIDLAANAVKTMRKSDLHFQNIQDLLKNSMFMMQQLEYQSGRRKKNEANESMYSRPQLRMSRPYSVNDFPFGAGGPTDTDAPISSSSSSREASLGAEEMSSSSKPTKPTLRESPSLGAKSSAVSFRWFAKFAGIRWFHYEYQIVDPIAQVSINRHMTAS